MVMYAWAMEMDYEIQRKIDEGNARIKSWIEQEKIEGMEHEFLALRLWLRSINLRQKKGTLRVPHILEKHYGLATQNVRLSDGCLKEVLGGRGCKTTGRILLTNI